jgi:flagellar assembly protein FliH
MKNNVATNATIVKSTDSIAPYELGQFIGNTDSNNIEHSGVAQLNDRELNGNVDPILAEIRNLASQLSVIQEKVIDIENDGIKSRDLDKQLVEAMKDLKNYASFFEQATFQMESKILKTSISIAQKIIAIEVGENSSKIANETIKSILDKIQTASKVTIHLNPKDYVILKDQLNLEPYIQIQEDANVTAGGVVIASDLGNFDGSVEAKIQTLLETFDNIV